MIGDQRQNLYETMADWIKTKQEPEFWDDVEILSTCISLMDLPARENNFLIRMIISVIRRVQFASFRAGRKYERKN